MSGSAKFNFIKKNHFSWNHQMLGDFFRRHREAAGLTLSSVASELDLRDASLLASYEEGMTPMPMELVFTLTNLYNIAPEDTLLMMFDLHKESEI